MKIIYPYNETLPLKKAHDAYIVRNCASLADAGHQVTLLIGKGSLDKEELFEFYGIDSHNSLKVVTLPILRRKNKFRLQCNFFFFWFAQRYIDHHKPDIVICSVLKQAHFHLSRKIRNCNYIYEVHQIQWYPTLQLETLQKSVSWERSIFNRCDLITVTTQALKKLLKSPPYEIKPPIEKIPLACDFAPLPVKKEVHQFFQLYYVGQLYASQGLKRLLYALKNVQGIELTVVGGKPSEIQTYLALCQDLGLEKRVFFKGFYSSKKLPLILSQSDAFITPFENEERMPYVAHTKLYEYQAWKKPIIAPCLEVVQEHLKKGVLYYEVGNDASLQEALCKIQKPHLYSKLCSELSLQSEGITWKKRGCLFNELLNTIQRIQQEH